MSEVSIKDREFYCIMFFTAFNSGGSHKPAMYQRSIMLPFPPFVGLEIEKNDNQRIGPLERVTYYMPEQYSDDLGRFECQCRSRQPENGETMEQFIEHLRKTGWSLTSGDRDRR